MKNTMAKYWDNRAQDYDELFLQAPIRNRCIKEVLARVPSNVKQVVDLGGGTGLLASSLLASLPGVQVVLVDISHEMLAHARSRLGSNEQITILHGSFEALPLSNATADAVVSTFALHHVDDRAKAQAAREVARVLRPGGIAIIVDEIIFRPDLMQDPHALQARMLEVFYPGEGVEFAMARFGDLEEWPTDPETMVKVFQDAGLETKIENMEDIVGILTARKCEEK